MTVVLLRNLYLFILILTTIIDFITFSQKLSINRELNQPIRQGDPFSLSCEAQGSPDIQFNWFKDGIYVNISKATR